MQNFHFAVSAKFVLVTYDLETGTCSSSNPANMNTTSDATLLPRIFAAVESFNAGVSADLVDLVAADNADEGEPLFVRGVSDDVRV